LKYLFTFVFDLAINYFLTTAVFSNCNCGYFISAPCMCSHHHLPFIMHEAAYGIKTHQHLKRLYVLHVKLAKH